MVVEPRSAGAVILCLLLIRWTSSNGQSTVKPATKCAKLCREAFRNHTLSSTNSTESVQHQCQQFCREALEKGFDFCREPSCLSSIVCASACQLAGQIPYEKLSPVSVCLRTQITTARQISAQLFWMPTRVAGPLIGFRSAKLVIHDVTTVSLQLPTGLHYLEEVVWSMNSSNLSLRLPFQHSPFSTDLAYMVGVIIVEVATFELADGQQINDYQPIWTHFNTPRCKNGKQSFKVCQDEKFNVSKVQDFYPPINVLIKEGAVERAFSVHNDVIQPTCHQAMQGIVYSLHASIRWSFTQEEIYNIEPALSCWCWESCGIKHEINITYQIGNTTTAYTLTKVTFPENSSMAAVRYVGEVSEHIFLPIYETEHRLGFTEIIISAAIRSYFVADSYFGPRYSEWSRLEPHRYHWKLSSLLKVQSNIIAREKNCKANTFTPTERQTREPPTQPLKVSTTPSRRQPHEPKQSRNHHAGSGSVGVSTIAIIIVPCLLSGLLIGVAVAYVYKRRKPITAALWHKIKGQLAADQYE